jgi:APA family basic amino acid/polyamine antiporter
MIGTGIFTSLGFQLLDIKNPLSIMLLWITGSVLALFGAFSYSEIAINFPRSGGEYNFTKELYHPCVGFSAGWVSLFAGFAAPVSLASMALGSYLNFIIPALNKTMVAVIAILAITVFHLFNNRVSSIFQRFFTYIKVIVIVLFVISGFLIPNSQNLDFTFNSSVVKDLFNPGFAVSLLYVSFAYSGWNATTYITNEVENPSKNIPRSLFIGTLVVSILYLSLNFVFLYTTPIENLTGKLEIGVISADYIFGKSGGQIMGGIISLLLVSTVSSMIFSGPRVLSAMGKDFRFLNFLVEKDNKPPKLSILIQSLLSILLVVTSTFEQVITFVGFILIIYTMLTVFGVFILKYKNISSDKYRTFGYPFTPLIFLAINSWFLYFVVVSRPFEALIGSLFLLSSVVFYFIINKKQTN